MAMSALEFYIFLVVIVLSLCIAILLLLKTLKQKKMLSLWLLTAFSFNVAVNYLFYLLGNLRDVLSPIEFSISTYTGIMLMTLFTKETFFKDVKNRMFWIINIVTTILFTINIITKLLTPYQNDILYYGVVNYTHAVFSTLGAFWFAWVSLKQYKFFKTQRIEPWIKKRYQIGGIAAISLGIIGAKNTFNFLAYALGSFENPMRLFTTLNLILTAIFTVIFLVGSIIAWLMPQKLRKWFNRGYTKEEEKEMSEEEILREIKDRTIIS
jgi:hypothetical protein